MVVLELSIYQHIPLRFTVNRAVCSLYCELISGEMVIADESGCKINFIVVC